MSYVKLHTVVQDFAVGKQSVNQATDNNAALYAQVRAKHTEDFSFTRGLVPGRHDDRLISRCVARYRVDSTPTVPTLVATLGGALLGQYAQDIARRGVGRWTIRLTQANISSVVPMHEGGAGGFHTCARIISVAGGGSAVEVDTWDVTAGSQVDAAFGLVLWAYAV